MCKRDEAKPKTHCDFLRELSQQLMSTEMGRTTEPKKRDTNKRAKTNTISKTGKARAFTQKQFDAMKNVPWDGEQHVFRATDDDDRAKQRLC